MARDAAGRSGARPPRGARRRVAGRQRDRDGRRLSESLDAQGFRADRDRSERGIGNGEVVPAGPLRAPLLAQLARTDALVVVGPETPAGVAAAARRARQGRCCRRSLKPGCGVGGRARRQPGAGFRRHRGSRALFPDAPPQRDRGGRAQRAFADHHAFRETRSRCCSPKPSRDALTLVTTEKDLVRLRRRGTLALARDRAVCGHAGVRGRRKVAEVSCGSAASGAREEISQRGLSLTLAPSARRGNAAAARRLGSRRLPADRRSSISARPAESAHRSPRSARRFRARSRGNRRPDIGPGPRHGPRGRIVQHR